MSNEDNRANHAQIIYQRPINQDAQPIGYDRDAYMHKVNALTYSQYGASLPNAVSPTRVHEDNWARSLSHMYGVSGNILDWSPVVELANLPTSGDPSQVNQQYVQVALTPTRIQQVAGAMRVVRNAQPTAYNVPVAMEGPNGPTIMSVSKTAWNGSVSQAQSGSNFFAWLVNLMIGKSNGNGG